jgi:hypothetical protein
MPKTATDATQSRSALLVFMSWQSRCWIPIKTGQSYELACILQCFFNLRNSMVQGSIEANSPSTCWDVPHPLWNVRDITMFKRARNASVLQASIIHLPMMEDQARK